MGISVSLKKIQNSEAIGFSFSLTIGEPHSYDEMVAETKAIQLPRDIVALRQRGLSLKLHQLTCLHVVAQGRDRKDIMSPDPVEARFKLACYFIPTIWTIVKGYRNLPDTPDDLLSSVIMKLVDTYQSQDGEPTTVWHGLKADVASSSGLSYVKHIAHNFLKTQSHKYSPLELDAISSGAPEGDTNDPLDVVMRQCGVDNPVPTPEEALANKDQLSLQHWIALAFSTLSEKKRRVSGHFYSQQGAGTKQLGDRIGETAKACNIPFGTVQSCLSRARQDMGKFLKSNGYPDGDGTLHASPRLLNELAGAFTEDVASTSDAPPVLTTVLFVPPKNIP